MKNYKRDDGPTAKADKVLPPERLAYSVGEVAIATGLGKTTLYGLIGQGKLRSTKIGNRRLIRSIDLEAMMAGRFEDPRCHKL